MVRAVQGARGRGRLGDLPPRSVTEDRRVVLKALEGEAAAAAWRDGVEFTKAELFVLVHELLMTAERLAGLHLAEETSHAGAESSDDGDDAPPRKFSRSDLSLCTHPREVIRRPAAHRAKINNQP